MIDPDQQRLAELKGLTQPSQEVPQSALPLPAMLPAGRKRSSTSDSLEEVDDAPATESPASDPTQLGQEPHGSLPSLARPQPLPDFTAAIHGLTRAGIRPVDLAQRVEQPASATIQLRDQREFKLSLEEDNSRDDALVDRLAEQTVTIVQQRDEALYQRVMQAIEQRLAQSRSAFS